MYFFMQPGMQENSTYQIGALPGVVSGMATRMFLVRIKLSVKLETQLHLISSLGKRGRGENLPVGPPLLF